MSALAHQLVNELHKATGDERFMSLLAPLMLEQIYRVLTTPETGGFNPRHIHFNRLQSVLAHIRDHLGRICRWRRWPRWRGEHYAFSPVVSGSNGHPPHRYVLATRLEEARKLLATTQLPIARIADECGFSSQSHFTACFGTAHASTPAEYRNQLQPQTASVGHHKRD